MFDQLTHALSGSSWAYALIFAVVAGDAVLPLLPGETIVVTGGVLATSGDLDPARRSAAATGAFVGDSACDWIGRKLGTRAAERFLRGERGKRTLDWAQNALDRRGRTLIVVARFVPGGRTAVALTAGTTEFPLADVRTGRRRRGHDLERVQRRAGRDRGRRVRAPDLEGTAARVRAGRRDRRGHRGRPLAVAAQEGARGLTLTSCQGLDRGSHVRNRRLRQPRPRVGPDAAALRRDRPAPARVRGPGHRLPLVPGRAARPAQPDRRAQGPRLHPHRGALDGRRRGEPGGAARHAAAAAHRAALAHRRGHGRPGCARSRRGSGSSRRRAPCPARTSRSRPCPRSGSHTPTGSPPASSRPPSARSSSPCATGSAPTWTRPACRWSGRPSPGTTTRPAAACSCTPGCRCRPSRGRTNGFTVTDLPAVELAATILHRGPMDDVMPTIQTLAQWIEANGYTSAGYNRELYVSYGDGPGPWEVELQEPVRSRCVRPGSSCPGRARCARRGPAR